MISRATIRVSNNLIKIIQSLNKHFSFKGTQLTTEQVFSPTGLLPPLTKRAEQLANLCIGYGLGASFTEEKESLVGIKVIFDDITPDAIRLLCIFDVSYDLINRFSAQDIIPLDELSYD